MGKQTANESTLQSFILSKVNIPHITQFTKVRELRRNIFPRVSGSTFNLAQGPLKRVSTMLALTSCHKVLDS